MTREDKLRELELLPVWQLRVTTMASFVPVEQAVIAEVIVTEIIVTETSVTEAIAEKVIVEKAIPLEEVKPLSEVRPSKQNSHNAELTSVPVLTQSTPTIRLLLSEDDKWLFLLASSTDATALNSDADAETLLQNMLRAIGVKTKLDISNVAPSQISELSQYNAKIMVIFGAVPQLLSSLNLLRAELDVTIEPDKLFESLRLKQHSVLTQPQQSALQFNALPVVVTYHPKELLLDLPSKARAWDDLKLALKILASIEALKTSIEK